MAEKRTQPKKNYHFRWRTLVVVLLTTLSIFSLIGFSSVHWVERQILTTSNWVKIVGPLPQNEVVASAISTYTVDKIFSTQDLQTKITNVLPPKASFLAPTISSELQSRLTSLTTKIIQSNQFNFVWVNANQAASQKLLDTARNVPQPAKTAKIAGFTLNLTSIRQSIVGLVGNKVASGNDANISVNLKTKMNKVKEYIRIADFLNDVLGVFALVCLFGALVLSVNRRKLIQVTSIFIMVIGFLQLIGVKALRPAILNQIHNQSFRPAVNVVYNAFVATYNRTAIITIIIGLVLLILTIVTQKKLLNRNKWLKAQLNHLDKSEFINKVRVGRQYIRKYLLQTCLGVGLIGLAIMAFALDLDTTGIIRSLLIIVLLVEIVSLAAARPRSVPMNR